MAWHTLPYWKKGLIIGVILNLLVSVIYLIFNSAGIQTMFFLVEYPVSISATLFGWGTLSSITGVKVYFALFVVGTVYYGIIGALVGKIIEKIVVYQKMHKK